MWRIGADEAYWSTYVWETGQGSANKTYIVASDATVSVCKKMMVYFLTGFTDLKKYCRKLKDDWQAFTKNPYKYRYDLSDEVKSFNLNRARDHLLDTNAFPNANKNTWKHSEAEVWTIVEKDLLYQQKAFEIVTLNTSRMGPEEAIIHLREDWRYCAIHNDRRTPVDYQAFICKGDISLNAHNGSGVVCIYVCVFVCLVYFCYSSFVLSSEFFPKYNDVGCKQFNAYSFCVHCIMVGIRMAQGICMSCLF
jgi:hypothetical protein